MAATLGHMDPFDVKNDDWSLYTERLGQFFVANDIADDKKKVAVLLSGRNSGVRIVAQFATRLPCRPRSVTMNS